MPVHCSSTVRVGEIVCPWETSISFPVQCLLSLPVSDGLWCAGFGRRLCISQGQLCCSRCLCCGSATPELQTAVWERGIRPYLLQTKQPALVCPEGWFPCAWKGNTCLTALLLQRLPEQQVSTFTLPRLHTGVQHEFKKCSLYLLMYSASVCCCFTFQITKHLNHGPQFSP